MNIRHQIVCLGCLAGVGLATAWANGTPSTCGVLKGTAQVRTANGEWTDSSSFGSGQWVRPSSQDATLKLPGMTVRLEKGASIKLDGASQAGAKLQARGGRVYVKVDADSPGCYVAMANKQVHATESEFILDAGQDQKLYVLSGQASVVNDATPARPLGAWAKPNQIALDGPDVRVRNRNRKRFTQGEENKGKRIGEDAPPTQTASPYQSPAYTPSPTVTPTFTPTATPQPPSPSPNPPTVTEGGFDPWPIAALAGAGGIAAIVITNSGGEEEKRVVFPASP